MGFQNELLKIFNYFLYFLILYIVFPQRSCLVDSHGCSSPSTLSKTFCLLGEFMWAWSSVLDYLINIKDAT